VINSLWFIVAVLGFFVGSTVAHYDAYGLPMNSTGLKLEMTEMCKVMHVTPSICLNALAKLAIHDNSTENETNPCDNGNGVCCGFDTCD
jgi:hypothetical protein